MNEYDFDDDALYLDDYPEEPPRFWTKRRIVLTIFAVLILLALFAYSYSGLFLPPPPVPTPLPRPLI
jgi:hypothetical protein